MSIKKRNMSSVMSFQYFKCWMFAPLKLMIEQSIRGLPGLIIIGLGVSVISEYSIESVLAAMLIGYIRGILIIAMVLEFIGTVLLSLYTMASYNIITVENKLLISIVISTEALAAMYYISNTQKKLNKLNKKRRNKMDKIDMRIAESIISDLSSKGGILLRFKMPRILYIAIKRDGRTDEQLDRIVREFKVQTLIYMKKDVTIKYKVFDTDEEGERLREESNKWIEGYLLDKYGIQT